MLSAERSVKLSPVSTGASDAGDRRKSFRVTAKLSRKFYEKFGDDLTNELVDWFNQVDATYRSELRELNELNFARFDAKLEQRVAEVKAELRAAVMQIFRHRPVRPSLVMLARTLSTIGRSSGSQSFHKATNRFRVLDRQPAARRGAPDP